MSKWIRNILAIAILSFLLWYVAEHWQQLRTLLRLKPSFLLILYALCLMQMCGSAGVVKTLLGALKTKTFLWNMFLLQSASVLLNYVPLKFGTLFRANYLKRYYGLPYARFATFFLYITFLMTATASAVGLVVLLTSYGLTKHENKILAGVFAITIVSSLFLLFMPLPVPAGQGKLSTTLRNFLTGRSQISKENKAIFTAVVLLGVNFLLTAMRIGIIYHSIGQDIKPGGYLILGALGFVVLFVGVTPGALGIRELVLGSGAVVLGIPLEVGFFAAIIDRAVMLSFSLVVGGMCVGWLWHRSPADFKKRQENCIATAQSQ